MMHIFNPNEHLPFFPFSIGYRYSQENIQRPCGAIFNQIFIVSDGERNLTANGKDMKVNRGDMFFLEKGFPHEYGGNSNFKTTFLAFDGRACDDIFRYLNIGEFGVYREKRYAHLEIMIKKVLSLVDVVQNDLSMSSMAYEIIVSFFHAALESKKSPIEEVEEYIDKNFSKAIALDDIMEFYPYSKTKLCYDFSARYGMTVFEMITAKRMEYAQNIIMIKPELSIREVAEFCGYNDTSYFCRTYKKFFGKTPRENH